MTLRVVLANLIGLVLLAPSALGQEVAARQVTMFSIVATPGGNQVDRKLEKIAPQLRKLFPGKNYSFRLVTADSRRLAVNGAIISDLGGGFKAGTELLKTLDEEGKLQMRFVLDYEGQTEFSTIVRTPPNQLFFCDKQLPNGEKLLIGLGGR